jgi:predicted transcriptional regulator
MSSITIDLSPERLRELEELAARLGVRPEELARLSVEELLTRPDEEFERAADRVIRKNEDLYRRLA